ncbi:phage tail protein [Vibrio cyclitrophicus]|uniref:Tail fiber protein n=1 Tax=Vibrio phage 1.202.O._10N.222.45.E8 TaxID=1881262 RepID=A0A2I7RNJ3_9CAUD|nr:phage tail protein [Vibrio cyclitrophicus]YP_009812543.1 tail fiber protein [Vibrio phage 1.202.O._10N.222.45.E8]AUR95216.1 tail fiber protein [Vibrio phage 1.202.O._10N.222.45.E8]
MANVSDKSILTAAGKALLAQLNAEEKALVIDKMIFANVPNRPEYPQPDDVVPTDNVVHQAAVEQRGRLSEDSVIYSTTLASNEGPFEFNWTGAYCSEYGVLVTIDHHSLTPKTVDEPGVSGNTLVRSVVLEYKDIAEITNITVDASTWQYNATPRMKKMDDDVAQANIDQNGKDWFIEEGFLVTPQASAFSIKAGAGYVSGNRVALEFDRSIQVPNKPSFIYIDAHREGTPTGEQVTLFDFVVSAEEKDDYIDSSTGKDVAHFICKIAQVLGDGSVSDLRLEGESAGKDWVSGNFNQVFQSVSSLKKAEVKAGTLVQTISYHDGWAAKLRHPVGGGLYFITEVNSVPALDGKFDFHVGNGLAAVLTKSSVLNVYQAGAYGDKSYDDQPIIQHVLDYAESNNKRVVEVPDGHYSLYSTLSVPRSVQLIGNGCETWTHDEGTVFWGEHNDVIVMVGRENMPSTYRNRGMHIEAFKVVGRDMVGCGVSTPRTSKNSERPSAYNWSARRVVVKQSLVGFQYDSTWHVQADQCVALDCDIGHRYQGIGGTSSNFNGLLAYSTRKGYEFLGDGWTYSSWNSCGSDGSEIALDLKGGSFRGSSFRNFGFENTSRIGLLIDNSNAIAIFDGLNIGIHDNPSVTMISVNSAELVKLNDVRCTSSVLNQCRFISINQIGSLGRVVFDNLSLYSGNGGDVGDIYHEKVMLRDSNIDGVKYTHAVGGLDGKDSSLVGYTSSDQNKSNLAVIATHILAQADVDGASRYLTGLPVFDTSNIPDFETVKFTNVGGGEFGFRTEEYTAGTGIVRNPTLSPTTTVRLTTPGDYVVFQKRPDGKLYEIEKFVV